MRRACRPSPAWLRWALPVCAAVLLAPRPSSGQCAGPEFGSFGGPNVSGEPWGVVTGDFWGATGAPDGALDVVVAKRSANMVTLLRGDGAGSFMTPIDLPVGTGPTDVVAADFNRDGLLDLAIVVDAQALAPVNRVQLLPGTGSGFGPIADLDVGDLPSRLTTGDFNRDGKPDLVVVSWSAETVQVYEGDGILGFTLQTPQPVIPADIPVAAVSGDFNLDGRPDLAVSIDDPGLAGRVSIYLGDGTGHLGDTPSTENPFATITVGTTPLDIGAGDVNRDGKPDLVTADLASVALSVLIGVGNGTFTREPSSPAVGAGPVRAVLEDFDRDGLLDVATLNPPGSPPHVTVLPGSAVTPFFDAGSPTTLLLSPSSTHEGLAAGDLDADGRPDLVATEGTDGNVVVALNTASPDCPRTSFLDAPRAFPGGNGAVWAAVGDLNGDGLDDLVIAASLGNRLEVLLNTGNGYAPAAGLSVGGAARGVAAADFDVDGNVDVVAAVGDEVQLFLGAGDGTLAPGTARPAGSMTSAVVAGDFNGDGAPDVAATAQLASFLYVFLGDGVGGLTALAPIDLGSGSRSLDAGDIDNNGTLDLVVARESTDDVVVLKGVGDGTFTPHPDSPLSVGDAPWGVALGHLDGDSLLDVATADQNASTITVWFRSALPAAGFENPVTLGTPDRPFSVAALDVTDDGNGDVAAVIADNALVLFSGNGNRTFNTLVPHPVRRRPSSIAAVDADADGRPDLAVPCKDADSVVVLLARPPVLARAPVVSVGSAPTGVVSADFDANGTLDLAVVNSADNEVTVLDNDGSGGFTPRPTSPVSVGVGAMSPKSIVVADFDRDGVLDLATSNSASDNVSILFGALTPVPTFAAGVTTAAGLTPDDLVVSDFDRDGDPDLAVCNSVSSGTVTFLSNDGAGVFASQGTVDVGDSPTSIFAADFDGNGWPDIAVANDNSADLTVRYNDGTWSFASFQTLLLTGGDTSPVSVTGGDFDGDGDVDLATVAFGSSMLSVYENTGSSFATTPTRFDAADQPLFVTAADLNRDGAPDLAAAADGMKVLPAQGGVLDFFPSEDVIAGRQPVELAVGDFNRDGVPDVAVVNQVSDDVSILLSSACQARRLVLSVSPPAPPACGLGSPYPVPATVQVQDDGGNLALCATGAVTGSVVPGTGGGGVYSGLPNPVPVSGGEALFNNHDITLAGLRYRLQFDLPGVFKVVSRSFTLEPSITVTGPPSVCSMATYTAEPLVPPFDSYEWTLDVNPPPHGFGPTTTVDLADGLGPHTLWVDARMDGCVATDTTSIYVGDLTSVNISTPGATTVCVDCLGGTVTAAHTGGGTPYTHQWGYRTTSGSPTIFDILGQTADTYVINGLDFPGVGTYYLVETTRSACGTDVVSTTEIPVTITASVPSGEVDSLGATSRGPGGVGENVLQWKNTVG
ncbi:MAG: VCBS repeat-containing protein, partial [Acidobacteria bacterium]|nr:VCBS repeat-containing protein [Acidobacteriota bacterium]